MAHRKRALTEFMCLILHIFQNSVNRNKSESMVKKMQGIMEAIFDVFYLSFDIIIGILLIKRSPKKSEFYLFGIMSIVLGAGDAFHLIPRSYALLTDGLANHAVSLGTGKLITSVTMTLFYVILYYVWRRRYHIVDNKKISIAVWALALARIILCLCPQNQWTSTNPPESWGILRNIPFAILGLIVIVLFYKKTRKDADRPFYWLWLTIVLSFAFYIPVVLWADVYPLVGILMIPKTCAYVCTIWIGYSASKKA